MPSKITEVATGSEDRYTTKIGEPGQSIRGRNSKGFSLRLSAETPESENQRCFYRCAVIWRRQDIKYCMFRARSSIKAD